MKLTALPPAGEHGEGASITVGGVAAGSCVLCPELRAGLRRADGGRSYRCRSSRGSCSHWLGTSQ